MGTGISRILRLAIKLATAGLLAVVAGGCGGGTKAGKTPATAPTTNRSTTNRSTTNGLENKSAAQVLQATMAALKTAKSVHVTGTTVSDGTPEPLDLRIQGHSCIVMSEKQGGKFAIMVIGNDSWFKGDQRALKQFAIPPEAMPRLVGRWIKYTGEAACSLNSLTAELAKVENLAPAVAQTVLNGTHAIVIGQDGSKLYVANTGPAYPLRMENKGTNASRLDFTGYGTNFHITPPRNALRGVFD